MLWPHENDYPLARGAYGGALYTAAFLLTLMAHELAPALVPKALGGLPVLHNTFVSNRTSHLPTGTEIAVALAGPLLIPYPPSLDQLPQEAAQLLQSRPVELHLHTVSLLAARYQATIGQHLEVVRYAGLREAHQLLHLGEA